MTPDLPPVPIHERLGIEVSAASPDEVVGTMPVAGNEQPFGALHGGASAVLAESLASIGSALHAGPDAAVVGHRGERDPPPGGPLRTSSPVAPSPLHLGRRVATWQVEICDDEGRLCCTARVTCLISRCRATAADHPIPGSSQCGRRSRRRRSARSSSPDSRFCSADVEIARRITKRAEAQPGEEAVALACARKDADRDVVGADLSWRTRWPHDDGASDARGVVGRRGRA